MSRSWTRLIRFTALETGGKKIHLGQPLDARVDVGLAISQKQMLKAWEISGASALDANAKVTSDILTVDTLLEPIAPEEIGLVRCLGLNYRDHAEEAKMTIPQVPVLFYKPHTALIPPLAPIRIPRAAQPVHEHLSDYEVELAVVIGKDAKDVPESEALDYVLGYTGANDVGISFRKHQLITSQWCFSKSFDRTNPIGPVLISPRIIPGGSPQNIPLGSMLNGQVLQNGTTADQIFSVARTIAFLSQGTTLKAGTLILTGTPAGVGFVREPKIWLKHGDEIRTYIGNGIGTLVNKIIEDGKARL
ncbi:Fumarylacetoacetate hydrolase [Ceratobasidium theobromae]|uniref:Fumarylacetoacetate hydrolase n=1 Tax=Ceratobasidium theobromae TaxID=1582974 RepID=A0A5N5QPZ4_9AGAM|nr:Fumarylacetoacetate hydrolase [Ceratobasidium theobromae]